MKKNLILVSLLAFLPAAQAQQPPTPHIGYAYPDGGRQGTTLQVKVGGEFLEGVTNVYISGAGVRASVVEFSKPLTPQQFKKLREELKALMQKRQAANRNYWRRGRRNGSQSSTNVTWRAQDEKNLMAIRKKIAAFARRPANPAIAETALLQVALAPNAEPGQRELRLEARAGLSNPLVFCVGQLPEFRKRDAQTSDEFPPQKGFRKNTQQKAVPPTETSITIPATVNGQILPGGVDRYRFQARKGQELVVAVSARKLIPYLADAVPGWFQATLTLYDAKGKELAYDGRYRFHPDPVIEYRIPKDGEYVVEIKDSIYRGREDFVYRMSIGELPFITSIFPLGGSAGAQTTFDLKGWNLSETKVTREAAAPGIYSLSVRKGEWISNPVPFAVDTLPEGLEQEPNNSPAGAQSVTLPLIINGRIDEPGDADVFRFEGHAGQPFVAEVFARRLESPLDSVLKLTDASGRQLAFNDDHEDKGFGLNTHHADSYLTTTLPAEGTYYVHLYDAQRQGGPAYGYRLRLSAPRPDFALRVVPSSINARAGLSVPITVYALRKDGFTNEIALALNDAPAGFALSGARIPANQDRVCLTLTAPMRPDKEPVNLSMEGSSFIQGQRVVRPAVPAEDMMQAFAYRHLVPSKEWKVAISGRFPARVGIRLLEDAPVKLSPGGTARVHLATPSRAFAERFHLELSDPPEGVTIEKVAPSSDGTEIVLHADAAKVKPGLKGNLIVDILAERKAGPAKKAKKQANQRRIAIGVLPAIPFEIE